MHMHMHIPQVRIFDQSAEGNHLDTAPPGGNCPFPLAPVNATRHPLRVGGQAAFGNAGSYL